MKKEKRNEERKKEMKKERKKWKKERKKWWKKERKKERNEERKTVQRPVISCVTASCQSILPNRRQFHLQASNFFLKHLSVTGYNNMLSRNVGDLAPSDKAPYCRRTETWSAPLREFKNSQNLGLFKNKTITSNQEWNLFRSGVTCDNRQAVG